MPESDRFESLVTGPEHDIPLDSAMFAIAAALDPAVSVEGGMARLDEIAAGCKGPLLDDLLRHLFVDLGFVGDTEDYYDPRNSLLPQVIERQVGIPISLSVLTIVIGRRIGVPLVGVGMPGHFLLRDQVDQRVFIDAFAGGTRLDGSGCARLFGRLHGPTAIFDPTYLMPVGSQAILARVLANLRGIYQGVGNRTALATVLRLRNALADATEADRRELVAALAASGQFSAAATALEELAVGAEPDTAEADLASATRMRARLN